MTTFAQGDKQAICVAPERGGATTQRPDHRHSDAHTAPVQPLRALIVISNLEYGGAQRQVVELANGADPSRHEIHVCVLSDYVPLADALRNRDRLHVVQKRFRFDASVIIRLARLLRRLDIDIVQGYLFDAQLATYLAGRLARTRVVIGSERNTDYHLKRRQLIAYHLTRGCVDAVIANSRAGAEFNRRTLHRRAELYHVIHNGVNTERFSPGDGSAIRRELGIVAGERVVGMFGSFKRQKNHPMMFAAIPDILARHPRTRFLFVGDELHGGLQGSDTYRSEMLGRASAMQLTKHAMFIGNRDDIAAVYRACDLTVLPSIHEGTPNVVLESMACGVPVVVTDIADNALIAPDGIGGFVVPLNDSARLADRVSAILGDASLHMRLSSGARDWTTRELSIERMVERTTNLYASLWRTQRRENARFSSTHSGPS